MPRFTTTDGTELYYKDWGAGPPVVFSHGWPLSADAWDDQLLFLASHGFRAIAHDRRGHGRSSQPWHGNDMDHYADDLAELLLAVGVERAILVGHSTGGGEVARYIGRHGTRRCAGAVLVGAVPPRMIATEADPDGVPREAVEASRRLFLADRAQLLRDLAPAFFGADLPGVTVSQGVLDHFWLQGMTGGFKNQLDCIAAFSETDFTEDLKRFDVPTLFIHGEADRMVPLASSSAKAVALVAGATLKVYPGGGHGLAQTHKDALNADLLAFARRVSGVR